MRRVTTIYLWLMVLMSLAFGAIYLIAPTRMTDGMGYGPLSAAAVTDVRAASGGFQLAAGVFIAWCIRQRRLPMGLLYMFFAALAFAVCRTYGLLVDGAPTPNLLFALGLEVTLTLATLTLYLLQPRDDARVPRTIAKQRSARVFAILVGLVLLVSGVLSALAPIEAMAPMGFGPMAPAALTDMRASYGGFQIGLAAFVLWCAAPGRLHAGLLALAINIGLVLSCRLIGFALDGSPTAAHAGAAVFEAVLTLIAALLFVRIGDPRWTSD